MNHYFVDTNVLVDLIADRKPFSQHAIRLFQRAETGEVTLYTSTHALVTTHYLLKKYLDESSLREVLLRLLNYVTLLSVDAELVKRALRSKHRDFEDAIQMLCATGVHEITTIVTRNPRDFGESGLVVLNPDEA